MYRYVLFDLDGTLTDPREGICKSVQYALRDQNIEEPGLEKLEPFIGPPLSESLREFYGMDDGQIKKAVSKFRERYETVGIYENELYPGMAEFLAGLQKRGVHLAVASGKPREFVEKVLDHFQIRGYFEAVEGSEKDGGRTEKTEIMKKALAGLFSLPEEEMEKRLENGLPSADILMVGDRKFDVEGARALSIDSAAVSYGYAAEGELQKAGADFITDNLPELFRFITGEGNMAGRTYGKFGENGEKSGALQKSIRILSPIVYDYLLSLVVILLLGGIIAMLPGIGEHSQRVSVLVQAVASVIGIGLFYGIYRKEKYRPISHVVQRRNRRRLGKHAFFLGGLSVCLGLFLNMAIFYVNLPAVSDSYETVAGVQYSVPFGLGLLIYGIIVPVEEELVFRGLVYGRMRKYFSAGLSIPVSALLFGFYHGNFIQGIYGFFMGCLLAWAFESYKDLKASALVHGAANLAVYTVSSLPLLRQGIFSAKGFWVAGVLTVVFAACLLVPHLKKASNGSKRRKI